MRKPKSKAMRRRDFLIRSYIFLLSLILVLSLSAIVTQTAFATTYVITDGEKTVTYTTFETDPAQVLGEAGVPLEEYDTYTTEAVEGGAAITISRARKVTVHYHGQTTVVSSQEETAGQLLQRLGLEITGEDVVSHGLEEKTHDGMVLTIDRIVTNREVFSSSIPYETQYREDETLPAGTETILVPEPPVLNPLFYYEQRCLLKVRLENGLVVLVIHFGLSPEEQENAVATVLDNLEDEKCILMGDFNILPDNPLLDPIRAKMKDTALYFDEPVLSFPSDDPKMKIDYIFVSPDLEVEQADIPAIVASDHRPHTAQIR